MVPIHEEEQCPPWRFGVCHIVVSSLGVRGNVFHFPSILVGFLRCLSWFWSPNALTRWKKNWKTFVTPCVRYRDVLLTCSIDATVTGSSSSSFKGPNTVQFVNNIRTWSYNLLFSAIQISTSDQERLVWFDARGNEPENSLLLFSTCLQSAFW